MPRRSHCERLCTKKSVSRRHSHCKDSKRRRRRWRSRRDSARATTTRATRCGDGAASPKTKNTRWRPRSARGGDTRCGVRAVWSTAGPRTPRAQLEARDLSRRGSRRRADARDLFRRRARWRASSRRRVGGARDARGNRGRRGEEGARSRDKGRAGCARALACMDARSGFGQSRYRSRRRGRGAFFREDGDSDRDSDRPELKKNARVDARVESVTMAAARFLFGGDAAAVFARSRVARATRRVLETSRVSSFTERKIGGVSKAPCALGVRARGRLAHSAAEASARSKRRLAEAEIARLRRRVEELLDARVEDDRALGESFTDPEASVEASDSGASALFAMRESLAACSRAREADADTLAVSESDRASATRAMRGAIEDKRRAESDRANAIEAMERSGAEAREARDALSDALERRLATTRLSFPPGDTNTRYEYELRGVAPDFVASASLVALIAITSLAIACVAFFARALRAVSGGASPRRRARRGATPPPPPPPPPSREAARKLRLELAASEASRVSSVEEVKRQARGDVENASAMMARLTSLAEKAEILRASLPRRKRSARVSKRRDEDVRDVVGDEGTAS